MLPTKAAVEDEAGGCQRLLSSGALGLSPSAAASHPQDRAPGLSSSWRAGPEGSSRARWPPGQLHPGGSACDSPRHPRAETSPGQRGDPRAGVASWDSPSWGGGQEDLSQVFLPERDRGPPVPTAVTPRLPWLIPTWAGLPGSHRQCLDLFQPPPTLHSLSQGPKEHFVPPARQGSPGSRAWLGSCPLRPPGQPASLPASMAWRPDLGKPRWTGRHHGALRAWLDICHRSHRIHPRDVCLLNPRFRPRQLLGVVRWRSHM